ncbi:uncharacterized protein [Hyperolius riggenbachi]|uniref:uncharacterized protein n=1 Tax=Hyperolius riggenbachi TaxID=752182 RepID=UPI0035A2AF8B
MERTDRKSCLEQTGSLGSVVKFQEVEWRHFWNWQQRVAPYKGHMTTLLRMDDDWNHMTKMIIDITLEIVYLVTREIFPPVKPGDHVTIIVPSTQPLIPKTSNKKKILEVTKKITELLVGKDEEGEVLEGQKDQEENIVMEDQKIPPPPQYRKMTGFNNAFEEEIKDKNAMEKEQYLGGYMELYKDPMMENPPPLTSQNGASNRNPPERSTGPLYSQDCSQKDHNYSLCSQNKQFLGVKMMVADVEEAHYVQSDQRSTDESGMMVTAEAEKKTHVRGNQQSTEGNVMMEAIKEEKEETFVGSGPQPTEEGDMMGTSKDKEEVQQIFISLDGCYVRTTPQEYLISYPDDTAEDQGIVGYFPGGNPITGNTHHRGHSAKRGTAPSSGWGSYESQAFVSGMHQKRVDTSRDTLNPQESFSPTSDTITSRYEKLFPHKESDKYFTNTSSFEEHQTVKTHELTYLCSVCGKSFGFKSNWVRHQRITLAKNPFLVPNVANVSIWGQTFLHTSDPTPVRGPSSAQSAGKASSRTETS